MVRLKKNIIILTIAIIFTIGSIFAAILIRNLYMKKEENISPKVNNIISNAEIIDECTEEYEIYLRQLAEETSAIEEKVSSNSILILKKYYTQCEHTINEYVEIPPELINLTQNEIQQEYPEWEVIGFSPNEVILYKEFSENCKEHFVLKNEKGKIVVYKILDSGEMELYERTEIDTEYLTETDLINVKNGFEIYGKEELNKILEDFE